MRPTKNMFATQKEWQKALVKWMNEHPTKENRKSFLVFEGTSATADNFMFEGDMLDFAYCYFAANSWDEVLSFVKDHEYKVVVEEDDNWDEIQLMLDETLINDDIELEDDPLEELFDNRRNSEEWGDKRGY
jgi:hypothetical protein